MYKVQIYYIIYINYSTNIALLPCTQLTRLDIEHPIWLHKTCQKWFLSRAKSKPWTSSGINQKLKERDPVYPVHTFPSHFEKANIQIYKKAKYQNMQNPNLMHNRKCLRLLPSCAFFPSLLFSSLSWFMLYTCSNHTYFYK